MILPTSLNNATVASSGQEPGGGLSQEESLMLRELWTLRGLNPERSVNITDNAINIGTKVINIDNTNPTTTVLSSEGT